VTTTAICLKGRQREVGPRLEWAPDIVYVGRQCTQGGWKLAASQFANPYRAQQVGGAAKAVELYREWAWPAGVGGGRAGDAAWQTARLLVHEGPTVPRLRARGNR